MRRVGTVRETGLSAVARCTDQNEVILFDLAENQLAIELLNTDTTLIRSIATSAIKRPYSVIAIPSSLFHTRASGPASRCEAIGER